jgi:hypothetical protein
MKLLVILVIQLVLVVSCSGNSNPHPVTLPLTETPTVKLDKLPTVTFSPTHRADQTTTPDIRRPPDNWQVWPVIPQVDNDRIKAIFQHGQELGNNPQAYSKIGDCEAATNWFLVPFDGPRNDFSLGEYASLEFVVDYFRGSHKRTSLASGRGFNAGSVLSLLWADQKLCETNETPLECEIRIHHPAYALVMLGTNDVNHKDTFETNMRLVIDELLENGVIPILATKADNLEGDYSINATIVRLAYEYRIPLWNFWLAVKPLPNHGLQTDMEHLTWDNPYFDDSTRMQSAWPWRNLTALQALNAVYSALSIQP